MTAASEVRNFRSIITFIVFIFTNTAVVFPFHIPIPVPLSVHHGFLRFLSNVRILAPRPSPKLLEPSELSPSTKPASKLRVYRFPINFATAPVIAVLFLLACTAIHRKEVHDGILGADGIVPISIMAFFLALAYIAISLDQTGLIRFVAVWVLRKGGGNGRRLYFYLYSFYLSLSTLFGNDPVVLSGTPFIAYMTTASQNIEDPRAWIYAQFAAANIASAILVSSNPTNLVLSGAFSISYVTYTANMIVPVVFTALVLIPVLFLVFRDEKLIPKKIVMHVSDKDKEKAIAEGAPVDKDGNLDLERMRSIPASTSHDPHALHHHRQSSVDSHHHHDLGLSRTKSVRSRVPPSGDDMDIDEILHPYLDRPAAIFCCVLFIITLAVLLATNAAGLDVQVYEITVPAAFVMLCRDMIDDWLIKRRQAREASPERQLTTSTVEEKEFMKENEKEQRALSLASTLVPGRESTMNSSTTVGSTTGAGVRDSSYRPDPDLGPLPETAEPEGYDPDSSPKQPSPDTKLTSSTTTTTPEYKVPVTSLHNDTPPLQTPSQHHSLESLIISSVRILDKNFPRACHVISQLPFPLLPFTFGMFILVQGLVTKGWVQIFANGWAGWVGKTGTLGAIGGMGFVSVLLCNFAGTNIGATIVLSRVLQEWLSTHNPSDRTKSASIYALALGVNYGAFSLAFSASLAALLWTSILERKGIHVKAREFARYNVPLIFTCMLVGTGVLAAQVYIVKDGRTPTD